MTTAPVRFDANPGLGQFGKIVPDARHGPRAERFDARGLQRVEHGPSVGIERGADRVEPIVMVTKTKRERIGGATGFGNELALQVRTRRRHPRGLARCRGRFRCEDDLDLGIAGDRPGGAGQCPAEMVDRLSHHSSTTANVHECSRDNDSSEDGYAQYHFPASVTDAMQ